MTMVTKAALVLVMIMAIAIKKRAKILKFRRILVHAGRGLKTSLMRKIKAKVDAETIWGICLKTPMKRPPLKKVG